MREFSGPEFRRVLEYGRQKAQEFPGVDVERTVINHLRAWAASRIMGKGQTEANFSLPEVELIEQGGELVGLRVTHVG